MKSVSRLIPLGLAVVASAFSAAALTAAPTVVDTGLSAFPYVMNKSGQFVASNGDGSFFIDPATNSQTPIPGTNWIRALNDSGTVLGLVPAAGVDRYGYPASRAMLWTAAGGYRDIGTLPGANATDAGNLNNAGQVCGSGDTADGHTHAFFWDGTMHDLGTLDGDTSWAEGMNNHGQVVGRANHADGSFVAFVWDAANGMREVPGSGGRFTPGINEAGVVFASDGASTGVIVWDPVNGPRTFASPVNSPFLGGWQVRGFLNDGSAIFKATGAMPPLPVYVLDPVNGWVPVTDPNGVVWQGEAMFSKSGYVAGAAYDSDYQPHAYVWDKTHGARLAPVGTNPWAVNDSGQVTGQLFMPSGDTHAFLWDAVNGLQDLGLASSNNSFGVVIGNGALAGLTYAADGSSHLFYAKFSAPTADAQAPVITSLTASPNVLWPVNKKMVAVTITANATDNVGVTSLKIVGVTCSEPATNFVQITGPLSLKLIADRAGNGPGRVYTITVEAADAAGNKSTKAVTVTVPHDQGK